MALRSLPWLPFEDVFITGVLAQKLSLERKHMREVLYLYLLGDTCVASELDLCFYSEYAIFWQNLNDEELRLLNRSFDSFDRKMCEKMSFHKLFATLRLWLSRDACVNK